MRLLPAVIPAVARLLAGHVRGQYLNGLGVMDGLAPRSWPLAAPIPPVLGKRDGSCASGQHPCSDVNSTSCCYNTQYCIVSPSWEVQCCEIGSLCDSPCDATRYYTSETVISTITTSSSLTAVTTTSTITQGICVGRTCTGSFYGCPSSLGGNCCGFGSDCATDAAGVGICIGSATSASTSASATSTSSALPTGAIIEHKSPGLSTGAKAGIAVGVIVVAALVIAALTYLCLRRRRRNGARSETTTAQELPSIMPAGRDVATATASGPHMSEADGDALSYGYAPSSTGLSRPGNGPAQGDYFGEVGSGTRGAPQQAQDQSRHQHRHPHGPDNVVAPVEIGTRSSLRGRPAQQTHTRMDSHGSEADGSQSELADTSSRGPSPAFGSGSGGPASPVESIAGRFELYGDFGTATATSGKEEFYDAQESARGNWSRGAVVQGSGTQLPQPFPTPGSEMSEFATPSPMSREEEVQLRRET